MGRTDVERSLENTFKGRTIENRPVVFRRVSDAAQSAGCHVLFLSGPPSQEMRILLKSPRATLMLIVGDDDTFAHYGALLYFSVESGRVVFVANGEAISRSRVHLGQSLLSLARFR
jgi:hypothetical protein